MSLVHCACADPTLVKVSLAAGESGELDLDYDRQKRTGVAEAVYAPGKSPEQCAAAVAGLLRRTDTGPVLLTRATNEQTGVALARNPGAIVTSAGEDVAGGALQTLTWRALPSRSGSVLILTAGTSDLPVAREVDAVLVGYGYSPVIIADVGVAGIHRVLAVRDRIAQADVVLVIAGMEGALASVVIGLTSAPVIAVPTSTGYGAGLAGVTALLGMLASCSPGATVVGIDNGFGAACAAVRILRGQRPDEDR